MTPARYQWIDNCKALGLLLVILGHGRLLPDSWQQFIYSFHMPFFSCRDNSVCTIISKGSLLVIGFNLILVMLFQTIAEKIIYPHPITPVLGIIISLSILYIFYWMTRFCQRYFPVILDTK